MKGKSVYKIPNGKLLKIFLDYDQQTKCINTVQITGDFFMHPEEAIELLEQELQQVVLNETILRETIESIITKHHVQCIGLDAEGLSRGIMMCVL